MKEILTPSVKLFLRTILINIMSFFVVMSVIFFSVAVFSKEIGYVAYGTMGDSKEAEQLYTYYNEQGEDTQFAEYEAKGYTITKTPFNEVDKSKDKIMLIVAQFFALGILVCFVYPTLWDIGNKDNNMVRIGQKTEDLLKGLKIGSIATVPHFIMYLFVILTKNGLCANLTTSVFKFFNASFYPVYEFIVGETDKLSNLNSLQSVLLALPVLVVPIVAFIGYYMGYKDFSINEKITYKNN